MGWLDNLFSNKKRQKQQEEEARYLQRIIEQNNRMMNQMNKTIEVLNQQLLETSSQVAATLEEEMERYIMEDKSRRVNEEARLAKIERDKAEKMVSMYLTKYLDRFTVINNRFSLSHNIKNLTNPEDLIFKIAQMKKLSHSRVDHVIIFEKHIIKLEIEHDSEDIWYSVDGGENMCNVSVGIKFLQRFIQDISLDILNLPNARTHNTYMVSGKNYKYVLARDEKECFFILRDKDMKTEIRKVDRMESGSFVKSLKSSLVYSSE